MNQYSYLEVLNDYLIPEIEAAGVPMVFMQDNAPCHKSAMILDFLPNLNVLG